MRDIATIEKELNDEKAKPEDQQDKDKITKLEQELATAKAIEEQVKTRTDERVKAAVEAEKQKLYDTVNHQKDEISKLTKTIAEGEQQRAEEEKKRQEEEDRKKEEEEAKKREEMGVKERLAELETNQKVKDEKTQLAFDTMKKEHQSELRKRDLALYREKVIAKYNNEIIPELVTGSSEEEIDKSAKAAHERYKFIVDTTAQQKEKEMLEKGKLPGKTGDDKTTTEPQAPAGQGTQNDFTEKTSDEIMAMSAEEFQAYKEKAISVAESK
jgi:hypothetical protein